MKNPNLKTQNIHSESKPTWNIVGCKLGCKYKIARVPYIITTDAAINSINRKEAFEHAEFINYCFNNSDKIL